MTGFTDSWKFHDPTSNSSHTVTPTSSGLTITIDSGARTDWWTTAPGSQPESSAHRDSGPLAYQSLTLVASQNWKLSGIVHQEGSERFQQTTLFVQRLNPKGGREGQAWLKSGIENEGGRKYVGVVATNPFSDWNVSPLSKGSSVHIEIEKTGPDVHVYYTVDGERLLLREKKGFVLPLDGEEGKEEWWVGVMVCGPLSEGTKGKVEQVKLELVGGSH